MNWVRTGRVQYDSLCPLFLDRPGSRARQTPMSLKEHISELAPALPIEVKMPREVRVGEAEMAGAGGEPTPFFFGAARRSGTTWLAGMLNAHPEIECRNEGWMFNDFGASFPEWLDETRVRAWATRREAQGTWLRHQTIDEALRTMRRAMWLAMTRQAVEREGWKQWGTLRYVGDKTTTHFCGQIDEVVRTFPDARFLHMLRDGRDAVVSDMFLLFRELERRELPADARREAADSREHHVFDKGKNVPLFGPAVMRYLVSEWAAAVSGGRRASELLAPGCWHEVRYEQIAEHPAQGLRGVLEWLGVGAGAELVEHLVNTHTFEQLSGGRSRGQEDATAEWRKGVSGDWRNHFTNEDKSMFKSIAGELLVELGYEQDLDW